MRISSWAKCSEGTRSSARFVTTKWIKRENFTDIQRSPVYHHFTNGSLNMDQQMYINAKPFSSQLPQSEFYLKQLNVIYNNSGSRFLITLWTLSHSTQRSIVITYCCCFNHKALCGGDCCHLWFMFCECVYLPK